MRQACWTIQDRLRSWRLASRNISESMGSGKYKDCLRLLIADTNAPQKLSQPWGCRPFVQMVAWDFLGFWVLVWGTWGGYGG